MPDDSPNAGEIHDAPLSDALSERYLAYALSTIMARSLPDVRDGLKPVHRRLVYAMHLLRLDPNSGFKKCARVVGDVIGKFHPHGEAAVYDAMVRLAQDFAARYPLVDGQGNFGNIDGDNAAAMRYTEARLTEVARALMDGIDEDAVDFRPNYDGEESEPTVLPAAIPNLLANGATGIAVGMATSIPPHNAGEVCAALLHLIKHPDCTPAALLKHMPGPDFPTGGVLVEPRESIAEAYAAGRGGFRLRARWEVEKLKHGQWQILVTEMPWQVQKARLIERIAQLMEEKKLPLLADIRDESAANVRLVLEPRNRTLDPEVMMETLFRATDLEVRISLNMNVLDAERTPRVMNLKEVLAAFLDHRHEVLLRRSRHRLAAIERRLEVLEGYLAVYLNLDEVIRIIREEDEPKPVLMRRFSLTDVQAEAVLNMRLRNLRKLDEMEIRKEHKSLSTERRNLRALLKDEAMRWAQIGAEIADIRARFGEKTELGRRRTSLGAAPTVAMIQETALIEREPITIVCSQKGWLRAMKGHGIDPAALRFKEGDRLRFLIPCETTDRLALFATNGRFYSLRGDQLPGGRGDGQPVRLLLDMGNEDDIVALFVWREGQRFLLASEQGRGFIVRSEDIQAETRKGKQVLNLDASEEAKVCAPVEGDMVAALGRNNKLLLFPLAEVPEMARGRGVILQKYKDGGLADLKTYQAAEGLSVKVGERNFVQTDLADWIGTRAQAGRLPWKGFPRSGRFG